MFDPLYVPPDRHKTEVKEEDVEQMILVGKKVNMMMRKSLVIVIPFKESLVFILNA